MHISKMMTRSDNGAEGSPWPNMQSMSGLSVKMHSVLQRDAPRAPAEDMIHSPALI